MTLVTLPAFRQRVHTRARRGAPATMILIEIRFGIQRRRVALWAWLTELPTAGCFAQMSHRWAMNAPWTSKTRYRDESFV